jgi:hypothetical protein
MDLVVAKPLCGGTTHFLLKWQKEYKNPSVNVLWKYLGNEQTLGRELHEYISSGITCTPSFP